MEISSLLGFLGRLHDVQSLIEWGGLFLICAIILIETGLFVGFFLPGDSLLFTAGVFAAAGYLNIWLLLLLVPFCAIIGDQMGYYVGRHTGRMLFNRKDSVLFKKEHLVKAQEFYEEHGPKTIVLARFVPIVRTFAPVVAGAAHMNYKKFTSYNVVGGILWVWSMVLAGFLLGTLIPNVEQYLHIIVIVIIVLSLLPIVHEYFKKSPKKKKTV
jgi:membrane-associated protein